MNGVDGALLAGLLLSAVIGLWRGLVYEVLSVAVWVVAFLVAQTYAGEVGTVLPMGDAAPEVRFAAGFAAVFIATAFAGGLLAALIKRMVAAVGLRPIDRVLGGVFGLLRGAVILLALALVVGMTSLQSHTLWQTSWVAQSLSQGLHTLKPLLPVSVARFLS